MPSKRLTKSAKSTSFDFGDYNAPAEEEESHQLSWRDDPERSLSDWTIVVRCEVTGASESFHVHKAMLAAGARWSEYFKSVFKSGMREGNTKTTTLELENSAAAAFPNYLDFVYTGVLEATSESATALLYLADYLRCRKLHNEVTQFMQGDLCADNAALYLAEAERYSLEKAAAAALPVCAASLNVCAASLPSSGGGYVTALPPPLFCRVVHAPERACSSEELSRLVEAYCRGPHAQSVDGAFLAEVTAVEIMPAIDSKVALSLVERAVKHEPQNASSLRERCVRACAQDWQSALLPVIRAAEPSAQSDGAVHRPKRQRGKAAIVADAAAPTPEPPSPLGCTIPEAAKVKLLAEALKAAADELESVKAAAEAEKRELRQTNASLNSKINQAQAEHSALCPPSSDASSGSPSPRRWGCLRPSSKRSHTARATKRWCVCRPAGTDTAVTRFVAIASTGRSRLHRCQATSQLKRKVGCTRSTRTPTTRACTIVPSRAKYALSTISTEDQRVTLGDYERQCGSPRAPGVSIVRSLEFDALSSICAALGEITACDAGAMADARDHEPNRPKYTVRVEREFSQDVTGSG